MKARLFLTITTLATLLLTSCSALNPSGKATAESVNATLTAISAQQTLDAQLPLPTLGSLDTPAAKAPELQPTPVVEVIPTDTPEPSVTPTSTFTLTPEPTLTLTLTPTRTLTTNPNAVQLTRRFDAKLRKANVLIYEELDKQKKLMGRADRVLREMGFSGGAIVNTHNLPGAFATYLKKYKWDLVILAVESRDRISLGKVGVLEEIVDHVEGGGALIVEYWNLDEDNSTLGSYILDKCQARVEKDWHQPDEPEEVLPEDYFISDLGGDTKLTRYPNDLIYPIEPANYWKGDVGDLIRLLPGAKSKIAMGLVSEDPNNYGLVTVCNEGRLVLQTFSSHDYRMWDMNQLWQNFIIYTLTNHFNIK